MKSTCKDNIWMGWRVYNLNNVPLDVDPKCIFVVQFYYRVFFFFMNPLVALICFSLSSVLGVGAVTACLKLHEIFSTLTIFIKFCLHFFLFRTLEATFRPTFLLLGEVFYLDFKALKRTHVFR